MTTKQLNNLQPGDIVQNLRPGNGYVVTDNMKGYSFAVRTITVSNPSEWKLMCQSKPVTSKNKRKASRQ